jgi:hypothetical protein
LSLWNTLDQQIHRAAFWATVTALATGVIQFFLPLDVPGGSEATTPERVAWLTANSSLFILGWVNQIAAMIALSGIFAGIAWQIAGTHPLRAVLAATLVALASMAFFINKFMAVWTIPRLADAIATKSPASEMAEILLPILNVSYPFSLYTSLDYLGFWLYSLFALLVARPLLSGATATKVAGAMLGAFGLLFNGLVISIAFGAIANAEIEAYVAVLFIPLFAVMIAALFLFRRASTSSDRVA